MRKDLGKILFVGVGTNLGGVSHYRTIVPARELGCSWVVQSPKDASIVSSDNKMAKGEQPDVVIFQMPVFDWHAAQMVRAKKTGAIVCANIDDYIPSIYKHWKRGSHGHGHVFDKKLTETHRRCIGLADYILCSTPWIAGKYADLGQVRMFPNGIDIERYDVEDVERDMGFVIGWAGGTGHNGAFREIAAHVRNFMWDNPDTKFVSMGDDMTRMVDIDGSLKGRVFSIKWNDLYLYPRDMKIFDVALAPAEHNDFFRGKSQLRLYEAGALSIPVIGGYIYDEIQHGVTGYLAEKPEDYRRYLQNLYDDKRMARKMGCDLNKWVLENATAKARIPEWTRTLRDLREAPIDTEA